MGAGSLGNMLIDPSATVTHSQRGRADWACGTRIETVPKDKGSDASESETGILQWGVFPWSLHPERPLHIPLGCHISHSRHVGCFSPFPTSLLGYAVRVLQLLLWLL